MSAIDLRFGRWQDVLSDVTCDALIVDAPYSERTHSGHDASAGGHKGNGKDNSTRKTIAYAKWTAADVSKFCAFWSPRTRGWIVSITDHVLARAWESSLLSLGRYVFPPLPFIETGSRVRLSGDGPSSWACWMVVARPSTVEFSRWGTLDGAYIAPNERKPVMGGKHLGLMRAIVRDYSRPGDLICDPCAGGSTTLIAAAMEGRRAVGAEMDPHHYEISRRRIAKGWTQPMFVDDRAPAPIQEDLFGGAKK
jgi:site-specific DNA-methyltransferase (adenine-specific)